jgi:hypothetical protein
MEIIRLTENTVHPPSKVETDFNRFALELEAISNRHGITITCIGDIQTFDPATCQVTYSGDFLSGDLEPRIHRRPPEAVGKKPTKGGVSRRT